MLPRQLKKRGAESEVIIEIYFHVKVLQSCFFCSLWMFFPSSGERRHLEAFVYDPPRSVVCSRSLVVCLLLLCRL